MNTEALILFLIILLGLVLSSFLGSYCREGYENTGYGTTYDKNKQYKNTETTGLNYEAIDTVEGNNRQDRRQNRRQFDNYNHYNKSSTELMDGTVFYGPNGGTVTVKTGSDGTQTLEITTASGAQPEIFTTQEQSTTVESMTTIDGVRGDALIFYGPNNATATVIYTNSGQKAIRVRTDKGTVTYTLSGETIYNPDVNDIGYYNPPGAVGPYNPPGYNPPGYNPPGAVGPYNPPGTVGPYNPPGYNPPGTVGPYNPPGYNPPGVDKTYFDSLPPGIPRSQIPPGQEDLYILKSQVVPPVCPACPACTITAETAAAIQESKCPPCPACERCPEPSFECKKVPSYSGTNSYLPMPVLADFSTFGM